MTYEFAMHTVGRPYLAVFPEARCGVEDCHIAVLSGSLSVYSRFKMYESLNKCTSKVMSYCHNLNTTLPHYVLTLRYFIVF